MYTDYIGKTNLITHRYMIIHTEQLKESEEKLVTTKFDKFSEYVSDIKLIRLIYNNSKCKLENCRSHNDHTSIGNIKADLMN